MAETINKRPDLARLTQTELHSELTAVRAALDAEPDVTTTSDGALTVGVAVLDLLDREHRLTAELRARGTASGRGW